MCALAAAVLAASPASAEAAANKAIWGPAEVDGRSQFPIYHDLGVDIYQAKLDWDQVAPTRPAHPKNPADPAYRWPAELDFVMKEAQR